MKIFLKCQFCRHAIGQVLDNRGRHRRKDEGQVWVNYQRPDTAYQASHLGAPNRINAGYEEPPEVYHEICKETYDLWFSSALVSRNPRPYPFHRFSLPFSGTPTKLGDPIPPPEEVKKLLRL